jgi:hypothetical protein
LVGDILLLATISKPTVFVDQLWLWCWIAETEGEDVSKKTPSTTKTRSAVLSAFPYTSYARESGSREAEHRTADIRDILVHDLENYNTSATDLVLEIISTAITAMFSIQKDPSLDFFEVFREAIGDAVCVLT